MLVRKKKTNSFLMRPLSFVVVVALRTHQRFSLSVHRRESRFYDCIRQALPHNLFLKLIAPHSDQV